MGVAVVVPGAVEPDDGAVPPVNVIRPVPDLMHERQDEDAAQKREEPCEGGPADP
jgi:hypothetical protein